MSNPRLTRQQLALFIKDDRTIRAFEALAEIGFESLPTQISDLLDLINGLVDSSDVQTRMKLKEIDETLQGIQECILPFVNVLSSRMRELEQTIEPSVLVNLDLIRRRLDAIESFIGI